MNCPKCGTPIPFDERFCRNCGLEVVQIPPTIAVGPATLPLSQAPPTESYGPQAETMRVSSLPIGAVATPTPAPTKDRSSFLLPITVASITIALVSLGVLGYFIFSKDKVNGGGSTPPGQPQPTVSPTVASSSPTPTPTPTPTVQPTATPAATPTPKPTPSNEIPPGARLGYCNDTNVFVRSAPNLNARPITKITRGQKLWVIGSSSNYSTWNGITSNWTQVQLYNGTLRGWVFSPFVSY